MTTTTTNALLQSLIYDEGGGDGASPQPKPSLRVLDQLLLPDETAYVDVTDIQSTWSIIRNMQIRGTFLLERTSQSTPQAVCFNFIPLSRHPSPLQGHR